MNSVDEITQSVHTAVKHGDTELTLSLIEQGAYVNQEDRHGNTPLHIAAKHGHTELGLSLIKQGASVNQEDGDRYPPLHIAVIHGHTELALSLIKHGASVNQQDKNGDLPLHNAVECGHTELALSLIKHGACVNQGDRFRDLLPLHRAVNFCDTEYTPSLIEHGASIDRENNKGYAPLHLAIELGHIEIALSLIEHGASVNQKNSKGYPPLHLAIEHGHIEIALSLIKHGASGDQANTSGDIVLHKAVRDGHTELVDSMLKHGASVNNIDRSGYPPLHIAVQHGLVELSHLLIKHGASVNKKDRFGCPPLHFAVQLGVNELPHLLIKHGASVNQLSSESSGRLQMQNLYIFKYLPITYYIENINKDAARYNDEIFTDLIPGGNMNILKTICQIFGGSDSGEEKLSNAVSSMLSKLIHRLILEEPLSLTIRKEPYSNHFKIELNQHLIIVRAPLKTVYLYSVLVILLGCNASFVDAILPELSPLHLGIVKTADYVPQLYSIVDLLNDYKQRTGVRKLQALCIKKTRQFMYSRTDESFQSLPVPPRLQNMLMLQDIAKVVFEGYKMWPKCIPIEELM